MEQNGDKTDEGTSSNEGRQWAIGSTTSLSKVMGDWFHDKSIPWKTRRRLLQTNSGIFPWESHLQKWGKHSDGICVLCKRFREMVLGLLDGKPVRDTTSLLQSSVCRLQASTSTGTHNQCFQQVQEDCRCVRPVQSVRTGTSCQKARSSQLIGS